MVNVRWPRGCWPMQSQDDIQIVLGLGLSAKLTWCNYLSPLTYHFYYFHFLTFSHFFYSIIAIESCFLNSQSQPWVIALDLAPCFKRRNCFVIAISTWCSLIALLLIWVSFPYKIYWPFRYSPFAEEWLVVCSWIWRMG